MLNPLVPAVVLAPMEGVTDAPMRAVQGEIGAFTYAVTEFLRVAQHVPPKHVFRTHAPELLNGSRTDTGLPVQLQLLGGDPGRVAEAAGRACELGAPAIDLNFGCPAPTVNRHDGGAALLKTPPRIRAVVSTVVAAVPKGVPVSAKLRLGWDTIDAIDETASMAAEGGAAWLTIHGRTRVAGYQPPVYWQPIGRVREKLGLPVIANGDIWTLADFRRCRDESGSIHFMLGRGALADPLLVHRVAGELGLPHAVPRAVEWVPLLRKLEARTGQFYRGPNRVLYRLKQWLSTSAKAGAFPHFDAVKRAESCAELFAALDVAERAAPAPFLG